MLPFKHCYMKLVLVSLFIIYSTATYSQDTIQKIVDNKCQYKIDGTGDALGIKMRLSIPCEWDSINEDRPHQIRSFSYKVKEGNYLAAILTITKTGYTPTKKELETVNFDEFFKGESWGQLISTKKVIIDAMQCTEAKTFIKMKLPQGETYQYLISYLMIYKDYFIVTTYKTMTFSNESSLSLFNEYERLFKTLAAGTILYNNWK